MYAVVISLEGGGVLSALIGVYYILLRRMGFG